MASITLRNLDGKPKARLRMQAAKHGRSMEDEARDILRSALSATSSRPDLVRSIRCRIEPLGSVDLPTTAREARSESPNFEE